MGRVWTGTEAEGAEPEGPACLRCGGEVVDPRHVATASWSGGRLLVIRGIPALACRQCGEEYIDDRTALALDRMKGQGFDAERAVEELRVPVFDFEDVPGGG